MPAFSRVRSPWCSRVCRGMRCKPYAGLAGVCPSGGQKWRDPPLSFIRVGGTVCGCTMLVCASCSIGSQRVGLFIWGGGGSLYNRCIACVGCTAVGVVVVCGQVLLAWRCTTRYMQCTVALLGVCSAWRRGVCWSAVWHSVGRRQQHQGCAARGTTRELC